MKDIAEVFHKLLERFKDEELVKQNIAGQLRMCNKVDKDEMRTLRELKDNQDFLIQVNLYTEDMDYDWFYQECSAACAEDVGAAKL